MTTADLVRIDTLEQQIIPDSWPRESFEDHLEELRAGGVVALSGDIIVGYACYSNSEGQLHLTNLAVDPSYRRKSVANGLLDHILGLAREQECELIFLEVRTSNEMARQFYESTGFSVIDTCDGYYDDPAEDALVMSRWIEPDGDGR
jgi:ribosomal-protein-alanine N-acetyltransferase